MPLNHPQTKKYLLALFLFIFLLPFLTLAQTPAEEMKKGVYGLQATGKEAGYGVTAPQSPELIIGKVINYVLAFVGVIFLILTIYGGIMWMTAGGNEEKVKKAKGLITRSVIGLVIILAAAIISSFILTALAPQFFKPT